MLVGHVLPICSMEWEKVLEDHNELWPSRTIDSIRKKFQKLSKTNMGTGETDCPEEITEAKRIHMEIVKRAEVDTCEDLVQHKKSWTKYQIWSGPNIQNLTFGLP